MRKYRIEEWTHFSGTYYYIYYQTIFKSWRLLSDDINNANLTTLAEAKKYIDKLTFIPQRVSITNYES